MKPFFLTLKSKVTIAAMILCMFALWGFAYIIVYLHKVEVHGSAAYESVVGLQHVTPFSLHNLTHHIYLVAFFISLLVAVAIWFTIRRLLASVDVVSAKLRMMSAGEMPIGPVSLGSRDEIGVLVDEFSALQTRLGDSLDLTQKMFGAASIGMAAYREDGSCVMANDAMAQMVGSHDKQLLLRQNFNDLDGWKLSGMLEAAKSALKDGEDRQLGMHVFTSWNKEIWLDCYLSRFHIKGEPHLLFIAQDTSEREEIHKRLQKSEGFFKSIIDLQKEFIIRFDTDSRATFMNRAYCDVFKTKECKTGQMPPESCMSCEGWFGNPEFRRAIDTAQGFSGVTSVLLLHDTLTGKRWVAWEIAQIVGDNGQTLELQAVGSDVTELLQTKQQLEEINKNLEKIVENRTLQLKTSNAILRSKMVENEKISQQLLGQKEYLRKILDVCPVYIRIKDREGRHVLVNEKVATLYGMQPSDMEGKFEDESCFLYSPDRDFIHEHLAAIEEGLTHTIEYSLTNNITGEKIYAIRTITPILSWDGQERYSLSVATDITALKTAQRENEEKERLLIQQARLASLGEMISMIAHQWRQPLTVISASVTNMQLSRELDTLNDKRFNEISSTIIDCTRQMSSTINDFMNFFKPDGTKNEFSIDGVVQGSLAMVGPQLANRLIRVESSVEASIFAFGYKNILEQALLNILTNARDAFEEPSGAAVEDKCIKISAWRTEEYIFIDIEDNAGGVSEDILDKIYEPYFTTKEQGKGTGIGLYMSKTILQRSFGGDITARNVYDELGKKTGAAFTLKLAVFA